jgi:hypothetical protein
MSRDVSDISSARTKRKNKEANGVARDIVDQALNTDVRSYSNKAISSLLSTSTKVVQVYDQINPAREKDIPAQYIVDATSSDRYMIQEANFENNKISLSLFSEGSFATYLPEDMKQSEILPLLSEMEDEIRHNLVVARERQKQFDASWGNNDVEASNPEDFLPSPLKTQALLNIFNNVDTMLKIHIDDFKRPYAGQLKFSDGIGIVKQAESQTFDIDVMPYSKRILLTFRDDEYTMYDFKFKDSLTQGDISSLSEALYEESKQNFATLREHDPAIKANIERFANAPAFEDMFEPDPEMDAYMKSVLDNDPDYQQSIGNQERAEELIQQEMSDNVETPRFRR